MVRLLRGSTNKGIVMLMLAVLYVLFFYISFGAKYEATSETAQDSEADSPASGWSIFQRFLPNFGGADELKLARKKFVESLVPTRHLGSLKERALKKPLILSYTQFYDFKAWPGMDRCSEQCDYTTDNTLYDKADLVLFQGWKSCDVVADAENGIQCNGWDIPNEIWDFPARNIQDQVWLFDSRESQQNSASGKRVGFADGLFNYTLSFKQDSSVFYPYGHTKKYHEPGTDTYSPYTADKKSKLILWLVSHCNVAVRDDYVKQLSQYLPIDEFGACSGKHDECGQYNYECNKKMKMSYKFYVAFENTICDEYITEKLWQTFRGGMVPIVLGTSMEYYEKVAPPNSFLHIDNFTTPQALAEHILYLDKNDDAYNIYQEWRKTYVAQVSWVRYTCELCRLASEKPGSTIKLSEWWNMDTQCKKFTKQDLTKDVLESVERPVIELTAT